MRGKEVPVKDSNGSNMNSIAAAGRVTAAQSIVPPKCRAFHVRGPGIILQPYRRQMFAFYVSADDLNCEI